MDSKEAIIQATIALILFLLKWEWDGLCSGGRMGGNMGKKIPIGIEFYKEMVDKDYYYVDKAIIQATIALINENGECIDDITVREICKKADVGLGLINYHFGSKENLIKRRTAIKLKVLRRNVPSFQSGRQAATSGR